MDLLPLIKCFICTSVWRDHPWEGIRSLNEYFLLVNVDWSTTFSKPERGSTEKEVWNITTMAYLIIIIRYAIVVILE